VRDELVTNIEQHIEIKAAPEKVFEGLIKHLCDMEGEPGKPRLKLKLERKPGGRWFRDLETTAATSGDSSSRSSRRRCSRSTDP